jgi:hypothetical protein
MTSKEAFQANMVSSCYSPLQLNILKNLAFYYDGIAALIVSTDYRGRRTL